MMEMKMGEDSIIQDEQKESQYESLDNHTSEYAEKKDN